MDTPQTEPGSAEVRSISLEDIGYMLESLLVVEGFLLAQNNNEIVLSELRWTRHLLTGDQGDQ